MQIFFLEETESYLSMGAVAEAAAAADLGESAVLQSSVLFLHLALDGLIRFPILLRLLVSCCSPQWLVVLVNLGVWSNNNKEGLPSFEPPHINKIVNFDFLFVFSKISGGKFKICPLIIKCCNGRPRTQVQHLMQIDLKGWFLNYSTSFQYHSLLQILNCVAGTEILFFL